MSHLPAIVREYLLRFNGETRAFLTDIAGRRGVDPAAVCAFAAAALQLNTAAAALAASTEPSGPLVGAVPYRAMPPVAAAAAAVMVAAKSATATAALQRA
jgi:hypothetical protein